MVLDNALNPMDIHPGYRSFLGENDGKLFDLLLNRSFPFIYWLIHSTKNSYGYDMSRALQFQDLFIDGELLINSPTTNNSLV